jgi:hypothetical protein
MTLRAEVELSGPFFTRDPGKTIAQNVMDFEDTIAAYGQEKVRSAIVTRAGSMARWTGWTRDHVIGRTRAEMSRGGRRWRTVAIVSANTDGMSRADAIRTKAAASSIERRWHPFRRASFAMRAQVSRANFTKGIE